MDDARIHGRFEPALPVRITGAIPVLVMKFHRGQEVSKTMDLFQDSPSN